MEANVKERYQAASTKQIKAALEDRLKWRGFSVTKGRGTGSHYVRVSWTNGPTVAMVDSVVARFNDSKNDDSMTDLWIGSQYTNTTRNVDPEGARQLLSTFDLSRGMPALWELIQEAGRLACRHNDASGWGAGEDWLELVKIERPQPIGELLTGFAALGYIWEHEDKPGDVVRYTFQKVEL